MLNQMIMEIQLRFKNLSDIAISSGLVFTISFLIIFFVFLSAFFISCTLSFQNISTHGTATDLVDEDQKMNPNISPTIQLPLNP